MEPDGNSWRHDPPGLFFRPAPGHEDLGELPPKHAARITGVCLDLVLSPADAVLHGRPTDPLDLSLPQGATLEACLDALPGTPLILPLHRPERRPGALTGRVARTLQAHGRTADVLVRPPGDAAARMLRRNLPTVDLAVPASQLALRGSRGQVPGAATLDPRYRAAILPATHRGRGLITPAVVEHVHGAGMALMVPISRRRGPRRGVLSRRRRDHRTDHRPGRAGGWMGRGSLTLAYATPW